MQTSLPGWAPYVLLVVTALVYSHGTGNKLTSFDDDFYIINNPFLRDASLKGIWAIFSNAYTSNYHPLTTLTFLFEYTVAGVNPVIYHVDNILIHLVNTWLVYMLADRLSGNKLTALVTSALFALHPMHVESVAWVSERKDVLYAAFYLSSLIVYTSYISSGFKVNKYAICLLLFVGSLLSKSAAVTLPLLLFAIDWYKGRRLDRKAILEKLPFLVLSVVFGIINIKSQAAGGSINNLVSTYSVINRVMLFFSGPAFYLVKMVIPYNLCAFHLYPAETGGWLPWQFYMSLPVIIVVVATLIIKTKIRKELWFGAALFLFAISVMIQFVSFGSAYASERYTYIPYIGFFYVAGQGLAMLAGDAKTRNTAWGVFVAIIFTFICITYQRIGVWKDSITLFSDVIEKNPEEHMGYWLRGNEEKLAGNLDAALRDYTESIKRDARDEDCYFNRARVYEEMKKPTPAILDYTSAIKLDSTKADVFNNRGWVFFETGDTVNALKDFNKALALNPHYAEAYNNRGWYRFKEGNLQAALEDFGAAINNNHEFLKAYFNRANIYNRSGNFDKAVVDYDSIISIKPDLAEGWHFRGISYLNMRDTGKACADWKRAREMGFDESGKWLSQYCR